MMNTGVEAVETALKLARKWGYQVKGIPPNEAKLVFCSRNFMGRTLGVISASTDESCKENFGPFLPGMMVIPYNDVNALQAVCRDPTVAAFMCEPIQGEAGVIVPDEGYIKAVSKITKENRVLWIADEVQTGLGRTGYFTAVDHDQVKPDIITLGKALSGGMMPVSAVLANDEVMLQIRPGQHGSTFGGNPLAAVVARSALDVLKGENMCQRSQERGKQLMSRLLKIQNPSLKAVRGRGLMMAIDIVPGADGRDASDLCNLLRDEGLLAKYTHGNTIRFAPPLVISEGEVDQACEMIEAALHKFHTI